MKHKDIKNWVLTKKKSITDMLCASRDEGGGDDDDDARPIGMDIDSDAAAMTPSPPIKTSFSVKGNPFRVDARYSYLKALGIGAYGIVCAARDGRSGRGVAVKKVTGVFEDLTDAKRIVREVRLLRALSHDNILKVIDMDEPDDYDAFADVYIVTELMDTDLNKLLRSSAQLLDSQRKFFMYHLLRALKYIHR